MTTTSAPKARNVLTFSSLHCILFFFVSWQEGRYHKKKATSSGRQNSGTTTRDKVQLPSPRPSNKQTFSLVTRVAGYPRTAEIIATEAPVFPDVAATCHATKRKKIETHSTLEGGRAHAKKKDRKKRTYAHTHTLMKKQT